MFKTAHTTVIDVDLTITPFRQWPEQARRIARELLMSHSLCVKFQRVAKKDRTAWLGARVESWQQVLLELECGL